MIVQLIIFIVVTVLAALAIAAFQDDDGGDGPDKASAAAGPVAPQRAGAGTRIGPAAGSVPVADWADRTYSDPSAGGAGFTLTDGAADVGSDRVTLGEVIPANLDGEPAVVVVLTRTPGAGGPPTHLVELFTFAAGNAGPTPSPVGVAAVAVPADPRAVATRWAVGNDAILRIRSYVDSPDETTRYLPGPAGVLVPVGP
ncbi:hypothetical protein GT354_35320 [Streptomyces sp. SID3343]|nr:hypothetical protein [Streptomyces sp. SID3343]